MHRLAPAGLLLSLCSLPLAAQEFDLSIQNIMRGPDLVGRPPQASAGGW
jgi:hypothetical protein